MLRKEKAQGDEQCSLLLVELVRVATVITKMFYSLEQDEASDILQKMEQELHERDEKVAQLEQQISQHNM